MATITTKNNLIRIGSQGENCLENTPGFQSKIDHLLLKCCILGEHLKNSRTESSFTLGMSGKSNFDFQIIFIKTVIFQDHYIGRLNDTLYLDNSEPYWV